MGKRPFSGVIVEGPVPLLERLGSYFSYDEGDLIMLLNGEKKFFSGNWTTEKGDERASLSS